LDTLTHSSLTQEEGASLRQGEDTALQQLEFLVILGGGFFCVLSLGRGVMALHGVVSAASWCAGLVLGFLHYQFALVRLFMVGLLDEIYLRKVGWVFPRVWGFPRITLCVFLCLFMLLIFSVYGI
jgi:hypothetical protein